MDWLERIRNKEKIFANPPNAQELMSKYFEADAKEKEGFKGMSAHDMCKLQDELIDVLHFIEVQSSKFAEGKDYYERMLDILAHLSAKVRGLRHIGIKENTLLISAQDLI